MVYGVGRLEAFRRAGGFADVFGPDLLLLARLVLQGSVERIEEPLYFRRQNRAEETFEEERVRVLADLNPASAPDRKELTYAQLMRELRDAHLRAVRSATTLSVDGAARGGRGDAGLLPAEPWCPLEGREGALPGVTCLAAPKLDPAPARR